MAFEALDQVFGLLAFFYAYIPVFSVVGFRHISLLSVLFALTFHRTEMAFYVLVVFAFCVSICQMIGREGISQEIGWEDSSKMTR